MARFAVVLVVAACAIAALSLSPVDALNAGQQRLRRVSRTLWSTAMPPTSVSRNLWSTAMPPSVKATATGVAAPSAAASATPTAPAPPKPKSATAPAVLLAFEAGRRAGASLWSTALPPSGKATATGVAAPSAAASATPTAPAAPKPKVASNPAVLLAFKARSKAQDWWSDVSKSIPPPLKTEWECKSCAGCMAAAPKFAVALTRALATVAGAPNPVAAAPTVCAQALPVQLSALCVAIGAASPGLAPVVCPPFVVGMQQQTCATVVAVAANALAANPAQLALAAADRLSANAIPSLSPQQLCKALNLCPLMRKDCPASGAVAGAAPPKKL